MKPLMSALLGLAFFSGAASADGANPDRLYIPLASYHHNLTPPNPGQTSWNEFNPGLVLTWENRLATLNYSLGAYLNSYEEISPMFSIGKFWDVGQVSLGAVFTFAHYGDNARHFDVTLGSSDFVFMPAVQMNYRNVFLQLVPAPQFNGESGAILAAGLTFELGQ